MQEREGGSVVIQVNIRYREVGPTKNLGRFPLSSEWTNFRTIDTDDSRVLLQFHWAKSCTWGLVHSQSRPRELQLHVIPSTRFARTRGGRD
jgi:hypothetical protein